MLFTNLMSVDEARERLLSRVRQFGRDDVESVPLELAHGRVLAEDISSEIDIPHYSRAAMDGYAVRSADVSGASRTNPVILRLGEQARWVHTGDAVPEGFDAVVKVEDTEEFDGLVAVYKPVRKYENIGLAGEDLRAGDRIAEKGTLLRAHHLALLRSAGVEEVEVFRRPRVLVIPTGDELVRPGERLVPGKVYESNGIMISSYLKEWGASPEVTDIVPDSRDELESILNLADSYDLVVTTGGTSVGKRDIIYPVLGDIGEVLFRGISLRPGKPTVGAVVGSTPVLALPGFPAACVASAYLLLRPAIRRMLHVNGDVSFFAKLSDSVYSKPGFTSFVRLSVDFETMLARPVSSYGSGILSSITKANCYTIIDENTEVVEAGEMVRVYPL
ncbi:molybdenum cofactor synthesis domain [Geoglobus ahangari]|uniref:Molybdenum cofactor synthesis domain n=1 Tax=Geoglobus ahangari TaxID=113653 RepID=A0A0F7IIG7_9EURY|nr:gephyrin-like molybdotransferase Glp [Geoglobus ahangari]AKG91775.1 molybdenum cofactor synthesis domain [Geoglobus ahangari]